MGPTRPTSHRLLYLSLPVIKVPMARQMILESRRATTLAVCTKSERYTHVPASSSERCQAF